VTASATWAAPAVGSARLMPKLTSGPPSAALLFLADRRPALAQTPAGVDLYPYTGRAPPVRAAAAYGNVPTHGDAVGCSNSTTEQVRAPSAFA
jgi:hypothetical protein